jgi:HD-like signal output (HDOD) protein
MRAFFATHDPASSDPIADALRARGGEWLPVPVPDADALRLRLAGGEADLVVVDLRLDGAEALLRHLLHTAPQAARVALCPRSPDEVPVRVLGLCHGVLAVSDPPELAADALLGYASLVQNLERPALRAQVGALTRLPGAPRLYLAICQALENPAADIADITAKVMGDPALAARVLQIANSAMFGAGRQIASLPIAVTRLGLKTLRNLVLAVELYEVSGADAARAEQVRQRSLLAAWLAPRMMVPHLDPDVAATAALLAGIGEMLPELDPGDVHPMPHAPPLRDEAAAYLLGLWQLPSLLQQAVAWQRTPRLCGERFGVVGAVHVATALAFDRPVDEAWLARCGMAAHLRGWRELAQRMERGAA